MTKTVLIVDDEPHMRLLLEQTLDELQDFDVELLFATNGEEALTLIRQHHPDLVFLDVMMPKMNGFDVCKGVRADAEINDTYIIMVTAKGQEFDRETGEKVGANFYLTKPFDPDYVLERAAEVLGIEL